MAVFLGSVYATAELETKGWDNGINKMATGMDKTQGLASRMAGGFVTAGATIGKVGLVAGAGLVAFATKAAFSAARVEELTFALHAIAKANGLSNKTVDDTVVKLRKMNISHQKALEITSLFVQSNLKLSDALKLSNAAKDLAVISGQDSSEATKTLTESIVSQQPELLRQFGIVTTLDTVYLKYAKKLGIVSFQTDKNGKTTKRWSRDLTENEKKQALLNTILTAGKKVSGTYEAAMGSVSKRYRSLTGRIIPDFIAQVGQAFTPTLILIIDGVTKAIQGIGEWLTKNQSQVNKWGQIFAKGVAVVLGWIGQLVTFLINNKEIIIGILGAFAVGMTIVGVQTAIAMAPVIIAFGAVAIMIALMAKIWTSNFLGIQEKTRTVVTWIANVAFPIVKKVFQIWATGVLFWISVFGRLVGFITGTVVPGIINFVKFAVDRVNWLRKNWVFAIGFIIGFIATLPIKLPFFVAKAVSAIVRIILGINWEGIWNGFWNFMKGLIGRILGLFKGLPGNIAKINWGSLAKGIVNTVIDLINGLIKGALSGIPGGGKIANKFQIPKLATGSQFFEGGVAQVGEQGPELVNLPRGSEVVPSHRGEAGNKYEINVSVGMYAGTATEKRRIGMEILEAINQVKTGKGLQPI